MAWWFAVLASPSSGESAIHTASLGGGGGIMTYLFHPTHRLALYRLLSQRFTLLYKAFVESRKAFRMGRTFIEYDKLRSMGWGDYLMGMLRDPISDGVDKRDVHPATDAAGRELKDLHSIPEHREGDESDHEDRHRDEIVEDVEEKKIEQPSRVIARPGRPHLPSRVSSNIGWGPAVNKTQEEVESTEIEHGVNVSSGSKHPPSRTVSELGAMYKSSRSSSLGWVKTSEDDNSKPVAKKEESAPAWKLIGSSLKLIGLMGFWTFDNVAFLTGTGFLDPFPHSSSDSGKKNDPKTLRLKRKKRASEWGARFYFMGSLAGLYVNLRGVWGHSNGALQKAKDELRRCLTSPSTDESSSEELIQAKKKLKSAETKHFELYVALLKSICDCIVFSNNPGVDLHLKYRGKKNHEGFHCCCGLVSASTVLFGNFPNA